jgi:hypothetical protein
MDGYGTTIRNNQKIHISDKKSHHAQTKHSTKATQTIKDTLHTVNTTHKKVKLSL